MGFAKRLGPLRDWRGAGLPLLVQLFRLKKNRRGVFPVIASQDVEIRDALMQPSVAT